MKSPAELDFPGSRWWKFDFHTHTPASMDWRASQEGLIVSPEDWVLGYMRAGIDCVAVTDHNSGGWVDQVKAAVAALHDKQHEEYRPLTVFPGVEISAHGGIHVLGIFDVSANQTAIAQLLGEVRYRGTHGACDDVTEVSCADVISSIRRNGGIAIPAHVEKAKGLLQVRQTALNVQYDVQTIQQALLSPGLVAMERVDLEVPILALYRDLKLKLTEVLGSDSHSLDGLDRPGSRFTWVKMAEPNLEGLRLALLDGASSVKRFDEKGAELLNDGPLFWLRSLEVRDARVMGRGNPARVAFHPNFTAIVGGRGSGKSSLVHALRIAAGREGELNEFDAKDEPRRTFERFRAERKNRKDAFGALDTLDSAQTVIRLEVRREGIDYVIVWEQRGNKRTLSMKQGEQFVAEADGAMTPARFPLKILSQGQIGALAAESQSALLPMLDEEAGTGESNTRLRQLQSSFLAQRAKIREMKLRLGRLAEFEANLRDVQMKIASFEESQHTEILKDYQRRKRQSSEVDRQIESTENLGRNLKAVGEATGLDALPLGLFDDNDPMDAAALDLISQLTTAVNRVSEMAQGAGLQLEQLAEQARQGLGASAFSVAVVDALTRYSNLVNELKMAGVGDPTEYGKLVQSRQQLEASLAELRAVEAQVATAERGGEKLLEEMYQLRRTISAQRKAFLDVRLVANPYVRIEVRVFGPDGPAWERQVRELLNVEDGKFESDLGGGGQDAAAGALGELAQAAREAVDVAHVVEMLRQWKLGLRAGASGQGELGGHFKNHLQREAARQPELLDRIDCWWPEDLLAVEYSPKGDGNDFRAIESGSAGQKAAAMLAFLLSFGEEPLILDQPEDDLDNHLIYDLIVRQIRTNKCRRQIVVVTHNPNIVVNGDAEMVYAMEFANGQCNVMLKGPLQEGRVREEICKVMEGGKEAFERRYRRLNEDASNV